MRFQFKEVTAEDSKILFEWRNDPVTRKNSLSTEVVTIEEHQEWFGRAIQSDNLKYFLVMLDERAIGTVRAKLDDYNSWVISWTIAPSERGKGYGKVLVKEFVESLSGDIVAYVKGENIASIKIATYAGLKLFRESEGVLEFRNF